MGIWVLFIRELPDLFAGFVAGGAMLTLMGFLGLVLGIVEGMATQYIPGQFGGSPWKDVWAFVLLILVLVFRPQGLLGAKAVDRA